MKKLLLMLPLLLLLVQCKSRKTSLQDDEEVDAEEFIASFPETALPFHMADTSLRKANDTTLRIGYRIFTQFIPDSFLHKDFGKNARPSLYGMGRIAGKEKETYLIVRAVHGKKRVVYLAAFDRKDEFADALPLVKTGIGNATSSYGTIDRKFQIITYEERRRRGELTYRKNVYFFNKEAKEFTLIFTEPNEDIIENVINPIDTLPATGKFAGDYVKDKKNFVSVRDGKNDSEILFFVHFEKNNGTCKGELKGTARFIAPNTAQYHEVGNPCVLQLTFAASRVRIEEKGGCGTYRDIPCFFEGSYVKKKK
jgi:hypothetical protein